MSECLHQHAIKQESNYRILEYGVSKEWHGRQENPDSRKRAPEGPEMGLLIAQPPAQPLQGGLGADRDCSASTQVKAAPAQDGGRNWNWREKILCPYIEV